MIRHSVGFALFTLAFTGPAFAQTEGDDSPYGEEAPAKGNATISGRIVDRATGTPIPETTIDIVGTQYRASTDSEGRYTLSLPPGRYGIRIWAPGYQPIRAQNLVIVAGVPRKIDVGLEPEPSVVEEYVIEGAPDGTSVDSLAIERKRSAAVGDAIGRAEMGKSPDRNAAQAARRVVGVNVVGNRFVYVRGLGERYTNALLNGAPLPSPEPDRAAVPLDMFPSLVLENLTIVKTFTPDVPGDFAGGSVRVETRSIPDKPLFQVSLSGGYNTQSTFRERLSHRGGNLDWLGVDDGTRALPDSFPEGASAVPQGADPALVTARGRDLNTYMSSTRESTPPNHSASVVAGDSWSLGADRKLGAIVALNYGRSFTIRDATVRLIERADGGTLEADKDLRRESGHESVSWGAYGSLTYQASQEHSLTLLGMHSQLADKDTYEYEGTYGSRDDATGNPASVHNTRLQFVTRALDFGQLFGDHDFSELGDAHLDWNLSLSRARRYEPDTRDVVYQFNPSPNDPANPFWTYISGPESGRHFFADQYENSVAGGIDWTQPLTRGDVPETRIKLGGLASLKSRNFEARRFFFRPSPSSLLSRCPGLSYSPTCPDPLFLPENIGGNQAAALSLAEGTTNTDAYDATLNVFAAYLMADVSLASDLRVIVGERLEITHQSIDPYHQTSSNPEFNLPETELDSADLLPAIAVVYSPTDKAKTRASLTRTLARPQLRELAPFAFNDYFGGRSITGNPDLELTHITNADLRFEYFPTLSEVLAFSIFFKQFQDPIEQVLTSSSDSSATTYQNADGANLIGIELEARKNLDFLSNALKDFSVISNLTLSKSRIQVRQTDRNVLTNLSRSMVNQAPYVFNLALDWASEELGATARVSYNLLGPRLVAVGTEGLDDAFEQERHLVDFSVSKDLGEHVELKLSGANVLNTDVVVTQGPDEVEELVLLRYSDGAVYTLTASYTY